jgi:hypothetical protein
LYYIKKKCPAKTPCAIRFDPIAGRLLSSWKAPAEKLSALSAKKKKKLWIVGSAAPVRCHVCQPVPFRSERRRRRVPVGRVHAHGSTAPSSSRAEPAANAAGPVRISAGQAYPRCSASSAESPNTVPAHEIAVGQRGVRKWMAVSVPRFKCVRQGMYDRLTSLSFCRGIGTAK